jgi:hypothetical protein
VAHAKHDDLRAYYEGRCGYCGVSDVDAGGEFTVDHYIPTAAGGDDSDDNLVYCCFRCNLYKASFVPSEVDILAGRVVLHPSRDSAEQHWRLNERTGQLEAISETGRFHIAILHLNRPALVAYRLRSRGNQLRTARQELLEAENPELRAIIAAQRQYIKKLRQILGDEPRE